MSLALACLLLLIGGVIGIIGGMLGIGGGVLVIPTLMIGFGFSQARANGTSVAMLLPPVGIFAVISYARAGNIDWRFTILLAIGFTLGAYFGAQLVNTGRINATTLRVLFAMLLFYVGSRTLFRSGGRAGSALQTCLLMASVFGTYALMRLLGRRWSVERDWGAIYRAKAMKVVEHDYEI